MGQELVSVIMSTYNENESWVKKAIESIINQTYQSIEFIIVLDNPDNAIIRNIVYEYSKKDNRIIVIENEKNLGLVSSLNKALKLSKGAYIARMDADDISEKERIEKQLIFLKKNKSDLVGSGVAFIDESDNLMFGKAEKLHYSDYYIKHTLDFQNCIYHPTWLVRKELFLYLNGYRNISYCEDFDFLLRAKESNAKLDVLKEVLVYYRYNTKGISRTNKANQRCITLYMRHNRNIIKQIAPEVINTFPNTKKGKRILADCEKYYAYSQLAIESKAKGKRINQLVEMGKCVLFTYNGKIKMIDSIRDQYLLYREKYGRRREK